MAQASYSSSVDDRGSLSPRSIASTKLTDITSRKSSDDLFDLDATRFKNNPVDKDNIFVAPDADDGHSDLMFMPAWRIWAARLVGVTAVAPELLALFLCRHQFGGLMARWRDDEALTGIHMLISLGLLSCGMIASCKCCDT